MALTGMMLKSCSVTTGIALTTSADVRHHSADSAVDSVMVLTEVASVMVLTEVDSVMDSVMVLTEVASVVLQVATDDQMSSYMDTESNKV